MNLRLCLLTGSMGLLLCAIKADAQQFVNGGFEPKATITPCTDVPVATYNTNMGGNRAIGTNTTMQIANSSCSQGSPTEGSYFGVMKYTPGGSAVTTFKLDKAMTVGTAYSFAINYKAAAGSDPGVMCSFRFGYGSDSTKADSFVAISDPISLTTWVKDTLKLTPKTASQYIWIEVAVLGGDPYTVHVDGLTMLGLATKVDDVPVANAMQLAPNPTTGSALLTLDAALTAPYTLQVFDAMGRQVLKREKITASQIQLDKAELGTGIFFLALTDAKQQVYTNKLVTQ